jgi:hypothetical protein
MKTDLYLRFVLSVIAGALVYLCLLLTPLPATFAQTTQRPGEFTGPGEMVIVGVRLPAGQAVPVSAAAPVPVAIANEVRVTGRVQTEQAAQTYDRVVLAGWEEPGSSFPKSPGQFIPFDRVRNSALPVTTVQK